MMNYIVGGKTQKNLADLVTAGVKFLRDLGLLGKYPPVWTRDVPQEGRWLVCIPGREPFVADFAFAKADKVDVVNGTMYLGPIA